MESSNEVRKQRWEIELFDEDTATKVDVRIEEEEEELKENNRPRKAQARRTSTRFQVRPSSFEQHIVCFLITAQNFVSDSPRPARRQYAVDQKKREIEARRTDHLGPKTSSRTSNRNQTLQLPLLRSKIPVLRASEENPDRIRHLELFPSYFSIYPNLPNVSHSSYQHVASDHSIRSSSISSKSARPHLNEPSPSPKPDPRNLSRSSNRHHDRHNHLHAG